jgi:hypothetical protein
MRGSSQPTPARHARPWLPLASLLLLGGCARQADEFPPKVMITEPAAGAFSRTTSTVVRGYALDDHGIAAIRVNGTPLGLSGGSRKIVPFAFRTSVNANRANYEIQVTDTSGLSTKAELPLRFDPNPPKIDVSKVERDGDTLRISGVATDDSRVASVVVDGSRLGVAPGQKVPFYAEATGASVEVVVTDAAGNTARQRVR